MAAEGLSDLKIVEYGHFISAPFCAKLMADLGSEVIKIEDPMLGDEARRHGPFYKDNADPESSGLFLYLNTGKQGVTVNLRSATGKKIFLELIKGADIFIENNPPNVMEELGLTYDVIREVNPRLIMTSITHFGQTGPYRDYKSSDLVSLAFGGVAFGTPNQVEDPEVEHPLRGGGHQGEFAGGICGATSTMLAVFHRMLTGEGQHVDVSTMDAIASLLRPATAGHFYGGAPRERGVTGTRALGTSIYKTTDGFASIGATGDSHFVGLAHAMGNPDWADNPLFNTREGRAENGDALKSMVVEWAGNFPKKELYQLLQSHHVPSFPVNNIGEVVNSEHFQDRGFFVEVDHPMTGKVMYPGSPHRYSNGMAHPRGPAPLLGQHNEAVLCGRLGYSKEDLIKLRETGVI